MSAELNQIKTGIRKLNLPDLLMLLGFFLAFFVYYFTETDFYQEWARFVAQTLGIMYLVILLYYLYNRPKEEKPTNATFTKSKDDQ